jgi:hypothetical protein
MTIKNNEIERDIFHENDSTNFVHRNPRPSAKLLQKQDATQKSVIIRPFIPNDMPSMYQVYRKTCQRVSLSIDSLNSLAAYIIVADSDNMVTIWLGRNCDSLDKNLAMELALDVHRRDQRNYNATEISGLCVEGDEESVVLNYLLQKCGSNYDSYLSSEAVEKRKDPLSNRVQKLFSFEKWENSPLQLKEISTIAPSTTAYDDSSSGTGDGDGERSIFAHKNEGTVGAVSRMDFIRVEKDSIAGLEVDGHWDIWFARGILPEDEISTLNLVNSVEPQPKSIHTTRQGCERTLFRRAFRCFTDFEPAGRTIPWKHGTTTHTAPPRRINHKFDVVQEMDSPPKSRPPEPRDSIPPLRFDQVV